MNEHALSECSTRAEAALDGLGVYFVRARLGGAAAEFLIAETEYQETALDRSIDHVITPEDVVVHKLIAWRERDRDDIRSLLANPGLDLDTGYIDDWAARWEVADRWRSIRDGRHRAV